MSTQKTRGAQVQQSIFLRTSQSFGRILLTKKYRNIVTFALLALAPVLIVATYMVLGGLDGVANPQLLRAVLLTRSSPLPHRRNGSALPFACGLESAQPLA